MLSAIGGIMLSDVAIRKTKPRERQYKLSDEHGLYVLVTPHGSKLWRMKYRFSGKEKVLSFGPYPEVSLADARAARDEARAHLRDGIDPGIVKIRKRAERSAEQSNTFEVCAMEWLKAMAPTWSAKHAAAVQDSLEKLVFPPMGKLPIKDITPPMVRGLILDIEKNRAKEIARRIRQRMSAVFVHAIACGVAEADPAGVIKGAFAPVPTKPQPAIIDLDDVRAMMRCVEQVPAHVVTKLALRFLALTAARPGEVRLALWSEIDADKWVIPAERMKMRRPHVIPLSQQAMDILDVLRPISGGSPYLFPSSRWIKRPMSENALGYLMNRAGFAGRHVPHGFRSSFSSIMNERCPADRAVIDLMLAHAPANKVEGLYNRAEHMERRRALAQEWANLLLEGFSAPAALLSLPKR